MASFDDLVTDRQVRLSNVREHLEHLQADDLFLGKYCVTRTAGSTGRPGIFLSDPTARERDRNSERSDRAAGKDADGRSPPRPQFTPIKAKPIPQSHRSPESGPAGAFE